MFEKNVGMIDRVFRAIFAVLFLAGGVLFLTDFAMLAAIFVGIVLLFTAMSGSCAIYSLFGISTCGGLPCDVPKGKAEPERRAPMVEKPEVKKPVEEKASKPKAKRKRRAKKKKP